MPISFLATEADTLEPGTGSNIAYSEGLAQGYRSAKFKNAFAFGHGLTYTTFDYTNGKTEPCGQDTCVSVDIVNNGNSSAAATPQLYLEFPAAASQASAVLKGFSKTPVLKPTFGMTVTFMLTAKDLSYWDGSWKRVSQATDHIGTASDDIRISVKQVKASYMSDTIVV